MLEPGTVLQKRYTIREVIGRGGMGTVYLAEQIIFAGRKLAIKQMDRMNDPEEYKRYSAQFLREAQLLGSLSHSGLVEVKDYFEEDDVLYLVMEYVEGESLEGLLRNREEPYPLDTVLPWMREVLSVLRYLHTHDPPVIFQDLKPSNLMLAKDGRIRLIDFGIARLLDPSAQTVTLTRGAGTPGYAAPEQHGGLAGTTADIYAAGATMYALLTATVPPPSLHLLLGSAELPPLSGLNPQVPAAIEDVVYRMMALLAANRYQSIAEVEKALEDALQSPHSVQPRRPFMTPPAGRALSNPPSGGSSGAPRLRRPEGFVIRGADSDGSKTPAPAGPELRVRRPSTGDMNKAKEPAPRPRPVRTCPGCGTVLEAGQICSRCLPEARPIMIVQPVPAALSDPLSRIDVGELAAPGDEKRPLLGSLFRRDTPSRLMTVGRPTVRRPNEERETVVQVVRCEESELVFHATEWFELGQPLVFTLGLVRDGTIVSHSSVTVVPRLLLVGVTQWRYTADITQDIKSDMARYLKMYEGLAPREQRSEDRLPCRFRITSPDLPHYQAISTDVSSKGLALSTSGPVQVGLPMTLRLDFDDDRFTHVVCTNQVRWCLYGLEAEYRVGTLLLDTTPSHAAMLRSYLEFLRHQRARFST